MHIFEPPQAEILERIMPGVIETAIAGHLSGRVKVMGVSWRARLCIPDAHYVLLPGTPVTIVGRCGNTVLVLPYLVLPYS